MSNVINTHTILKLINLKVEIQQTVNEKPRKTKLTQIIQAERSLGYGIPSCTISFNTIFVAPITLRPSEVARLINNQPISKQTERADETGRFLIETIIKPLP